MIVERVELMINPGFIENCYLLHAENDNEKLIVVDPGSQFEKLREVIGKRSVYTIVITHRHYDHIGALVPLQQHYGAEVIAFDPQSAIDASNSGKDDASAGAPAISGLRDIVIDRGVNDEDEILLGTSKLEVLHTPGHSIDSICLYDAVGGNLISGDTIFYEAVGRTDLPTGSAAMQKSSLMRLARLADETRIYPGHDQSSSIGHEKQYGSLVDWA